jgi:Dyp-type peroxidase family
LGAAASPMPPVSNSSEPFLDGGDIQGNIIPGLNRAERLLVAFSCLERTRLQDALRFIRPLITSMNTALAYRDERKQAFVSKMRVRSRPELWVNLALSVGATNALGAAGVLELDDEDGSFAGGMTPGLLGDPFVAVLPDGSPNPSQRSNWRVGSPATRVDLLLIFAHDANVSQEASPIVDEVARLLGAPPVYQEEGRTLSGEVEHFGFRDGISQPGIRGRTIQDGVERLVTTRYGVPSRDGIDFGKAGQALVWPGQFLTGQPLFEGDQPALPPELSNGSFLVFRRLTQDVRAFYRETDGIAADLSARIGQSIAGADLRTRIVGRFPSGASLMRHAQEPAGPEGLNEVNYFDFGTALPEMQLDDGTVVTASFADPDVLRGRRCPVWAHTRKVNPRGLGTNRGGPLETVGFQMLRRGIPFGPPYDHAHPENAENQQERGLLFLSYQRKIAAQFSILNHDWMNNRDAPQAGGFDLLVGQHVPDGTGLHAAKTATFFGATAASPGDGSGLEVQRQWVTPTGGAFLFAPSMAFIDKFAVA